MFFLFPEGKHFVSEEIYVKEEPVLPQSEPQSVKEVLPQSVEEVLPQSQDDKVILMGLMLRGHTLPSFLFF